MTTRSSQDESEKPAKVYQINSLVDKIDNVVRTQEELKTLIVNQSNTYPTRTELQLELQKRDSRISAQQKTLSNYSRVVWTLVTAVIPMLAISLWQLIVNSAKGGLQ
ncbi:hypothetical protein [Dietzia natronolimnaea]|uniref:hypothetical protein n=1 Tax=Dietzia natronolimnaea TaxID=161920 RepID=UPI0015FA7318|nr:hypothetical protein [Dietzia natronolimnaea]MBB1037410.1 hypothetical protein [Dietzia natronolimnaea]